MDNVFSASDWLEHKSRRKYIDYTSSGTKEVYKRNMPYNSTSKRGQFVKTANGGPKPKAKHYGGVKKANYRSVFKQPTRYDTLIEMAIRRSPLRALNVAQIHAYIADVYPYFKTCPGSLKASIIKTLSMSTRFEKLGEPEGEPCKQYWTLTNTTQSCVIKDSSRLASPKWSLKTIDSLCTTTSINHAPYNSQPTPFLSITGSKTRGSNADRIPSEKNYSQATMSTTNYTPISQCIAMHPPSADYLQFKVSGTPRSQPISVGPYAAHSQASVSAYASTPPNSQPEISHTVHWPANYKETGPTHDDKLRHFIHNSPLYPRVPVITPTNQSELDESGIKIGEVFSLRPQTSTVLSAQEPLRTKVIPYHPCTFWSRSIHNSPKLSTFVSEDKERYEDA